MIGEERHLRLRLAARGDVLAGAQHGGDRALGVAQHRVAPGDLARLARLRAHERLEARAGGSTPETSRRKARRASSRSSVGTTISNQSRPSSSRLLEAEQPAALVVDQLDAARASSTTTNVQATSR